MKQQPRPRNLQLNLPLLDLTQAELPANEQRELALALTELLLSAAGESAVPQPGGDDEPEADV
jgi:hypothetical protein